MTGALSACAGMTGFFVMYRGKLLIWVVNFCLTTPLGTGIILYFQLRFSHFNRMKSLLAA
ncbi:Uncharacterised protein [Legionella pneumophila]|nr:Uncharacterised protein [Legionella pneumophila]